MWETFVNGWKLRNTCRVNNFIHSVKSLPLVGRLVPYQAYCSRGWKQAGMVVALVKEILSFFVFELLYVGLMLILPACLFVFGVDGGTRREVGLLIFQMFVPMTLVGGLIHAKLFESSQDGYYGIVLMRMNAREYALSQYLYYLVKKLFGFTIVLSVTGVVFHMSAGRVVLSILYWLAVKFCGAWLSMQGERAERAWNPGPNRRKSPLQRLAVVQVIGILLLLLFAYGPIGAVMWAKAPTYLLPEVVTIVFMLIFLIPGVAAAVQVFHAQDYQRLYKRVLSPERCFQVEDVELELKRNAAKASMELDTGSGEQEAERTQFGFAYFHALFVKRHRKLLQKRARIISLVILAAGGLLLVTSMSERGESILGVLWILPIALYFINTGEDLTQAMFMNCDRSMLTYNFYRKRDVLLGMFRQRLRTLIRINFMPAGAIAFVLAVSELRLGAGDMGERVLPAGLLAVTPLVLSIFFSVHRLVMYYLLQPYNEAMETKKPAYRIVSSATYFVCYMLGSFGMGEDTGDIVINPYMFAAIAIGFCILYVPVALALVYRFAPKTFRLR